MESEMAEKASINNYRKPHFTCISNVINCTRDRCHITPEFTIQSLENTTWSACLTFGSDRRPILGSIRRIKDDGPKKIQIEFGLKYYDSYGYTMIRGFGYFRKNYSLGEMEFPEMVETKYEICSKDSYILECCISRKGTEILKSELCFASAHYNVYHRHHVWAVKRFSLVLQGEKRTKILNGITKECPQIKLNLSSGESDDEECIFIHLEVPHLKDAYAVEAQTSLLDYDGNVIVVLKESAYLHGACQVIKLAIFEKDHLECRELLSDDVLLVQCRLKITTANTVWSGINDYRLTDSKALQEEGSSTYFREPGVCPFKETVNKFRDDLTLSDVSLRVGSESFAAHKFILSSRSPVFKAMFVSAMKEKNSTSIDIPDLDAEAVKRMLLYIYKDEVQELTWKTAGNLLKAADKYELMDLKEKCSCFLRSNLCKSNVCEILVLADMHRDEKLTNSVQEFILNNSDIICSDVWKVFKQNHSKLALETAEQIIVYKMKHTAVMH